MYSIHFMYTLKILIKLKQYMILKISENNDYIIFIYHKYCSF